MTDKQEPPKKPRKPAKRQATPAAKGSAPRGQAARKTGTQAGSKRTPKPKPDDKASQAAAEAVANVVGEAARSVGRPSKYSDEFVPMMIAYFDIDTERVEQVPLKDKDGNVRIDEKGNVITEPITIVNRFPTLERFASKIGVTRLTLANWANELTADGKSPKYPEFLYAYTRAREMQAALLQEGGLGGVYEPRVVTLALKNIANWQDKVEEKVISVTATASIEELDRFYEDAMRQSEEAKARALARRLDAEGEAE